MESAMEFELSELGAVLRAVLRGRLDTAGVGLIETRFTAGVVPPGRPVVVDLSEVSFVSSMGLRMIIGTARALRARGAAMALYGAQPLVRETLDHVALGEIIPIAETEADALARLGA